MATALALFQLPPHQSTGVRRAEKKGKARANRLKGSLILNHRACPSTSMAFNPSNVCNYPYWCAWHPPHEESSDPIQEWGADKEQDRVNMWSRGSSWVTPPVAEKKKLWGGKKGRTGTRKSEMDAFWAFKQKASSKLPGKGILQQ